MENKTIGIVGLGFVGGAVFNWFKESHTVYTYDKYKKSNTKRKLDQADIIFVCVPTPFKNGECDISALEEAFEWLPQEKIVIIKSTIPPGTTDHFAKNYEGIVVFNPEFLDSSKAEYDFSFPQRQIIGIPDNTANHLQEIIELFDILPKADNTFTMSSKEAEIVKYIGNTFFLMKNVFCNMWADYCKHNDINYETVRKAFASDSRIGHTHTHVDHKGGRGAGGSCLPKDIAAAIEFMNTDTAFLELAKTINDQRLRDSNKYEFGGMYDL